MKKIIAIAFFLAAGRASIGACQTAADSTAIRQTALDYIQGWYTGDGARMERALHPELAKRIVRSDSLGRYLAAGGFDLRQQAIYIWVFRH